METEKTTINISDGLKWLGDHRDGFLVSGAILYGLGYLVWTYNAWTNHLGQLPALEFQYFISGLFPGVLIALAWLGIRFLSTKRQGINAFIRNHRKYSIFLLYIIEAAVLVVAGFTVYNRLPFAFFIFVFAFFIIYVSILPIGMIVPEMLINTTRKNAKTPIIKPSPDDNPWGSYQEYVIVAGFIILSMAIYINLYPYIPQEFGGPKPRCAYVDLVREEISSPTLTILVLNPPVETPNNPPKVVRSEKLKVYFSSSDYMLVRNVTDAQNVSGNNLKNTQLIELRKDVIRDVVWCKE